MKNYYHKTHLTIALITAFFSSIAYLLPINAQLTNSGSSGINFTPPPPPPDRSAAGERGSAASRGCGSGEESLMALVPDYKETINLDGGETIPVTKIWGLTTDEYPTFWFFVPYDKSSITEMEFVIQDKSQKPIRTIYREILNKPEKPGIISVSTKKAIEEPLQIGKTKHQKKYHWFLKLKVKCSPQQAVESKSVDGWIERVNLNPQLTKRIEQATPLQKAALYAENGIWHNALTTLGEARLSQPNNASFLTNWLSLLKSEKLDKLENYPLVNCCQTERVISDN
ncbi:MAG: DUF928 domain-containing protein [Cyanobacteriota bacterium]|nr:DUF928 domain-containing protein [Cyanobacteriota bacterium]